MKKKQKKLKIIPKDIYKWERENNLDADIVQSNMLLGAISAMQHRFPKLDQKTIFFMAYQTANIAFQIGEAFIV